MSGELKVDIISSSTNGTMVEVDGDLTVKGILTSKDCNLSGDVDTVDGLHGTENSIDTANEESTLATKGAVKCYVDDRVPAGSIMMWALGVPPIGWLECNGDWKSIAEFSELYNTIGGVYGLNTEGNTFKLPDYRGYFLRGWDNGAGNDPDALSREDRGDGQRGDVVGTTQGSALWDHGHAYYYYYRNLGTSGGGNWTSGTGNNNTRDGDDIVRSPIESYGSGNGAPDLSTESRPKNINVMFIIKY